MQNPVSAFKAYRRRRANEKYRAVLLAAYEAGRASAARSLGYSGAEDSRLTGAWRPGGQNANQLIRAAAPLVRARVRDLVRNFPPFERAINATTAFVVGDGVRYQSLVTHEDGSPNKRLRAKIESAFRAWMENPDVAGRLHFYELQQLAHRQIMENGEFICRFVTRPGHGRPSLALQMHDSEDLSTWDIGPLGEGSGLFQGVEYDLATGRPLRYHFQNSISLTPGWDTWTEKPENVLHGFYTMRAGQLRGISPFAPALLTARDMDDYTMSELDRAKMAAKYAVFVTSPDPGAFQVARGLRGQGAAVQRQEIDELENGIIEYLRQGEKVEFAPNPGSPGDSFDRFIRHAQSMISVVAPLPYEILSGNYSGMNYTVSKSSRNDFSQILKPKKFHMDMHFVQPVYNRWLDFFALENPGLMPGYFDNPAFYRKAAFIMAGMPSIDPLREGKADIDNIKAGLKSPQEIIIARGGDPERVLDDLSRWREMCEERGLDPNMSLAGIDTSLANNPAKLGAAEMTDDE